MISYSSGVCSIFVAGEVRLGWGVGGRGGGQLQTVLFSSFGPDLEKMPSAQES